MGAQWNAGARSGQSRREPMTEVRPARCGDVTRYGGKLTAHAQGRGPAYRRSGRQPRFPHTGHVPSRSDLAEFRIPRRRLRRAGQPGILHVSPTSSGSSTRYYSSCGPTATGPPVLPAGSVPRSRHPRQRITRADYLSLRLADRPIEVAPAGQTAEKPVHWRGHRTGRADIVTKSRAHEASKNVAGPGVVEESSLRPLDGAADAPGGRS